MIVFLFKSFIFTVNNLWKVSNPVFKRVAYRLFCSDASEMK